MYKEVLRVYDQDCIIYNPKLDGSEYDSGSSTYESSIERETSFQFNWPVWFAMITTYLLVLFFNSKSVTTIRYIVIVSWPLSILFLFVLVMKAITLDGGADGVYEYIWGKPDKE